MADLEAPADGARLKKVVQQLRRQNCALKARLEELEANERKATKELELLRRVKKTDEACHMPIPQDLSDLVCKQMARLMRDNIDSLAATCTETCIQQVWAACWATTSDAHAESCRNPVELNPTDTVLRDLRMSPGAEQEMEELEALRRSIDDFVSQLSAAYSVENLPEFRASVGSHDREPVSSVPSSILAEERCATIETNSRLVAPSLEKAIVEDSHDDKTSFMELCGEIGDTEHQPEVQACKAWPDGTVFVSEA
eukprot:CAMPEP_0194542732 /NCGR_PEP_ID=MMETSP0253-20130528/84544_1 /TAXON_ID=2966 /ORGANISM="Noctiluca scintillans" /LENGTH=254 /DNA_ID=CAMNT_0039389399 /DNA_START=24 /DNA_END=788 /DNA_ORIENTATION=-